MAQSKVLPISLLLSLLAFRCNAQDLNATIVGCEAVQCPMDNWDPHCTLTNITFENIGLTRIPDVPESLKDFSIVKGVNISAATNSFTSVYYLGTPQDVSLEEVHGCAVIFHDPPQKEWEANGTHTCSEVIDQKCIEAIQDRASKVAEGDSEDLCGDLQKDLEDNPIDECENLTGGQKGIGSISSKAFSDLQNVEGDANSTSDCWPILPKSANLADLFTETNDFDGGLNASTAYPELNRITPLLTLFVKGDGSSVVDETVSRLTCISMNSTQTMGPEEGKNASPRISVSALAVGSAFALFLFML